MTKFFVKKLDSNAKLPHKVNSVGYELYSLGSTVLKARGKELIKTGLSFQVPSGNLARITSKLDLALKNFLSVETSFVAEDYLGEVCILLMNHSNVDFQVHSGDGIAQVIIEKVIVSECVEIQPESAFHQVNEVEPIIENINENQEPLLEEKLATMTPIQEEEVTQL